MAGVVWLRAGFAGQQDLGPAELDMWGEPAPVQPWNEGDGNSSGAEHLKTHTDSLTRGKYTAVFRSRCLSTAKQPQTLHSHMDPSATIQIYVHGLS